MAMISGIRGDRHDGQIRDGEIRDGGNHGDGNHGDGNHNGDGSDTGNRQNIMEHRCKYEGGGICSGNSGDGDGAGNACVNDGDDAIGDALFPPYLLDLFLRDQ